MPNLLNEAIKSLHENGKSPKEVLWCEKDDCYFTWKDFKELADLDYTFYETPVIASNLRLYGTDFWLERYEFDGTEGWSFISILPEKPREYKKPESLVNKLD